MTRRRNPFCRRTGWGPRFLVVAAGFPMITSRKANGGSDFQQVTRKTNTNTSNTSWDFGQQQQQQLMLEDGCFSEIEENHIGKMYLDFQGDPNENLSEEDLLSIQALLSNVYHDTAIEICYQGYRSLYGVEIDKDSIILSESDHQFRVPMNVISRCKGCSNDLRFFSNARSGRSQNRFLEREDTMTSSQTGSLGQRKRGNRMFDRNSDVDQSHINTIAEPFLSRDNQRCDCPPPSRQQVLTKLRRKLSEEKAAGKLKHFEDVVSLGAYFSGLRRQRSSNEGVRIGRRDWHDTENSEVTKTNCSQQLPFIEPFLVADSSSFQRLSSCPFSLHEHALGRTVGTCFPIYNVPHWDSPHSVTFLLRQLKLETVIFFEKDEHFATWEELLDQSTANDNSEIQSCLDGLDFSAVGVRGEISGEMGTSSISTVVTSFLIEGEKQHWMLPVGGCEDSVYVGGGRRRRTLLEENVISLESCSLQPNKEGDDLSCLEECLETAERDFASKVVMLEKLYDAKLFKNNLNEKAVTDKLFLKRTADTAMVLAQCLCKENEIEECVLGGFLESVAVENDESFEAMEIFLDLGLKAQEAFVEQQQIACVAVDDGLQTCQDECNARK